jgi:DNA-binding CsgD family transcriptional regulator
MGTGTHEVEMPMNDTYQPESVPLTEREQHILRLLTKHGSTSAVATAIGLSERHTRRLIRTLQDRVGVDNTHALVAWATIHGVLDDTEHANHDN